MTLPDEIRAFISNVPSWPFQTAGARTVWEYAAKALESEPTLQLSTVLQTALWDSKVPAYELTPDDYGLLNTALRWKLAAIRQEQADKKFASAQPALPPQKTPPRRR